MNRTRSILCVAFISIGFVISCTDSSSTGVPKRLDGNRLWRLNCTICHGADGKLEYNGAFDLSGSRLDLDQRILVITKGRNKMQAFEGILDAEQIEAVARYSMSFNTDL